MSFPDRWLVLTAHIAADDPLRDLLAEGLIAYGGLSILEEPGSLTTYLNPPPDPEVLIREAETFLTDWIADDAPALTWRWQQNEDWEREWRKGLQPRKVSSRFVVKPSWTEWNASREEIIIEIDPEMAFGTGEHATTRGCLRLLDEVFRPGDSVLDIGSGSAILAIAAARLGASRVLAVEYDPDANINARDNISRNAVEDRVELREALATPPLLRELGSYDLILANILSGVIRPLLPALREGLAPGGRLIVSGILQREAADVVSDAGGAGLRLVKEDAEEDWWSAVLEPSNERD